MRALYVCPGTLCLIDGPYRPGTLGTSPQVMLLLSERMMMTAAGWHATVQVPSCERQRLLCAYPVGQSPPPVVQGGYTSGAFL